MNISTELRLELPFRSLDGCWKDVQSLMQKVVRWLKYRKEWPTLRKQNNLQHTYGMEGLAIRFLARLRATHPSLALDEALILAAVHVHDQGEMRLASDVPYALKSSERDLKEYLAFEEHLLCEEPYTAQFLRRAFLLQFAMKNPECFPTEARTIMRDLTMQYSQEAHCFDCIERIDYILYANEAWESGTPGVLVRVLHHQYERLEELAQEFAPFRELFWKEEGPRCQAVIEAYKGQFVETA